MLIKKPYKLIAFDVDGTILDANYRVCSELKKVVAHLRTEGYAVTIVSARFPASALDIADELGLDQEEVIALNGSLITNKSHDVFYSKTFALARIEKALADLNKQVSISYYHEFDWLVENASIYTDAELGTIRYNYQLLQGKAPAQLNKVTLMGKNELLVQAQDLLGQDDTLLASFSHPNYLELACKTITKLSGLQHYAKQKQISMEQIIAFGDGENDMPMLAGVGLGVAMANAPAHVKKVAHAVTDNNFEQGVAKYLKLLINSGIL
ncbi:MAG: Cof-type HAD-IIB family hydrolase [Burkholderiales bacterium]